MNKSMIILLMAIACVACSENAPKADRDYSVIASEIEYDNFRALVAAQPAGMKLDQFLKNIGAERAEYDKCYSANPYIVPWVFHLGKVRMDVQVERYKDGYHVSPDYVPSVAFDGMSRRQRMNSYYHHMGGLLKKKNDALDKLDKRYFK